MITPEKLVEQLGDYHIRSRHKYHALVIFSTKPYITSRTDVAVAVFWALLFAIRIVSPYHGYFWLSSYVSVISFWYAWMSTSAEEGGMSLPLPI